ncbi:MAG: carbamoyl-phosphate synthase large chain, partial [Planctomycetota bacterium]
GFELVATGGTARAIEAVGIPVRRVNKIQEGRPNVLDLVINDEIGLLINTPSGKDPRTDEATMRKRAVMNGVPTVTTISAADAVVKALENLAGHEEQVAPLQEFYN